MLHELYIDLWTARAEAAGKCCMPPDHYSADLQMCIVFLANLCTSAFLHVAHVNASRHSQTITFLSCQICCLVLAELSDFSEHNPDGDAGNTNTRLFVAGAGAAPGGHPAAGNDYRAELAQAKRREAEASTRVAALEAKLKSSSSGFGEMQATIQELTHRVQVCRNIPSLTLSFSPVNVLWCCLYLVPMSQVSYLNWNFSKRCDCDELCACPPNWYDGFAKILLAKLAPAHILHHCLSFQASVTGQPDQGLNTY